MHHCIGCAVLTLLRSTHCSRWHDVMVENPLEKCFKPSLTDENHCYDTGSAEASFNTIDCRSGNSAQEHKTMPLPVRTRIRLLL
jgi:hypothetical protein